MFFDDAFGNMLAVLLVIALCGVASYFGAAIAIKRWARQAQTPPAKADTAHKSPK